MTSPVGSSESPMSLDSEFSPPSRQQWIELAVAGLRSEKSDAEALLELQRITLEGIPLASLYDSAEMSFQAVPASDHKENWDNRLSVYVKDAKKTQQEILKALAGGITSIELHTSNAADIAPALQGVQLDLATISLRSAQQYQNGTDELVKLAAKQGIDAVQLQCELNADPIGTYLQGDEQLNPATIADLKTELDHLAKFAKTTAKEMPLASSVLVDASQHHNAGASTVEELHAALATALQYLEAMLDAGMKISDAAKTIKFKVGMDADVLLGVAKIRALKALWQHLVKQIDPSTEHVCIASIVAETSLRHASLLEPWNNHLRNLAAGTAALIGGADTLLVHPHDALQRLDNSTDTELGDRMARNIAIILERECGLRKVYDPMAGAYAIENLTQQLMHHAWESLGSTDTSEGWLDELISGRWQTRLHHTHQQRITLMNDEKRIAIGVNRFVKSDDINVSTTVNAAQTRNTRLQPVRDADTFEQQAMQGVAT